MSNALTRAREDLRQSLEDAGLFAWSFAPEQVTPPFAYVGPDEPYMQLEGAGYGGRAIARFVIGVVAEAGTNDVRAEQTDELVLQVMRALWDTDWAIGSVDEPGEIGINGQSYIAAPIHVHAEIDLNLQETP